MCARSVVCVPPRGVRPRPRARVAPPPAVVGGWRTVPIATAVAAATTVAAAPATPTAAIGWLAHVDARCGCVCPLGDGVVHSDLAAVYLKAVAAVLGHFGIVHRLEVDEGETSRATRLSIIHHLDILERAVLGKDLLEVPFLRVKAESKHAQAPARARVVPAPNMASPI